MQVGERERIAVIGAGLSGLVCARMLVDAGHRVAVFDKGRGIGGRLATRRAGALRFDHGAVALTPVGPDFADFLTAAQEQGHAALWPGQGGWTGLPGMRGLITHLSTGLDITSGAEVSGLARGPQGWALSGAALPEAHGFDRVILAVPQPQAVRLLAPWPGLVAQIAAVSMQPCWTLMAGFDSPLDVDTALARFDDGPIAVIAHENTKPGRSMPGDAWVIQASAAWTQQHLEDDRQQVEALLLAAFRAALGGAPVPPTTLMAHRWRYALTDMPLRQAHVMDAEHGLALCGDWCLGASAEAAFDSGRSLAAAILAA